MIEHAGIAIFVFGNKRDATGIISSNGMREEFDLCIQAGVKPLPIGGTGFMAETLWKEVSADMGKHFPSASAEFKRHFRKLGNASKRSPEILETIQNLIEHLQKD